MWCFYKRLNCLIFPTKIDIFEYLFYDFILSFNNNNQFCNTLFCLSVQTGIKRALTESWRREEDRHGTVPPFIRLSINGQTYNNISTPPPTLVSYREISLDPL